jgi:serine/threonine protein kinase
VISDSSDVTRPLPRMVGPSSDGPRPGDRLADRYELREEIGRGGMGSVFRAHDGLLGRDVAIKVLARAQAADGDFQRASVQEARAAARLVHPGIVTVYDVGAHAGWNFLVMELVEGQSLEELLRQGPLAPAPAVEIATQVADALEYAHRQGVLHCDVKPHNIMVIPGDFAKLVDFGIAHAASVTGAISPAEIYGSVPYLAPEQVRGERPDARADVYALGAVLYEMLTGRPPFVGQNVTALLAQRLTADPPSPRSLNGAIPPELERVVMEALARERSDRFPTAERLAGALRRVAVTARSETVKIARSSLDPKPPGGTAPIPPTPPQPPMPKPSAIPEPPSRARSARARAKPPARKGLLLGALVVAVAAVVVGLWMLLSAVLDRGRPVDDGSGLPGSGWAQFTKASCEWSNVTTPPGICFGEREPGFRVRVVEASGRRWQIWDPTTQNVAYVDADALKRE